MHSIALFPFSPNYTKGRFDFVWEGTFPTEKTKTPTCEIGCKRVCKKRALPVIFCGSLIVQSFTRRIIMLYASRFSVESFVEPVILMSEFGRGDVDSREFKSLHIERTMENNRVISVHKSGRANHSHNFAWAVCPSHLCSFFSVFVFGWLFTFFRFVWSAFYRTTIKLRSPE